MTEPTEERKISATEKSVGSTDSRAKAALIRVAGSILVVFLTAAITGVVTYYKTAFPPYNEELNRFDYSTFEEKLEEHRMSQLKQLEDHNVQKELTTMLANTVIACLDDVKLPVNRSVLGKEAEMEMGRRLLQTFKNFAKSKKKQAPQQMGSYYAPRSNQPVTAWIEASEDTLFGEPAFIEMAVWPHVLHHSTNLRLVADIRHHGEALRTSIGRLPAEDEGPETDLLKKNLDTLVFGPNGINEQVAFGIKEVLGSELLGKNGLYVQIRQELDEFLKRFYRREESEGPLSEAQKGSMVRDEAKSRLLVYGLAGD